MQTIFPLAFPTKARKNKAQRALTRIAVLGDVWEDGGRSSPRALVEWIADHAALVIALIHATRADADETRRVLAEVAAQEAAEEK